MSRRTLIASGAVAAAATLAQASWRHASEPGREPAGDAASPTATAPVRPLGVLDPHLLRRALGALDSHAGKVRRRDRIAIADFTAPSSEPRLHLVDLERGSMMQHLVAHGSGSDPHHTGFLQRFSNTIDSNASSEGAFVTADYYEGKHGNSQKLLGLDPSNSNALTRAIVVHGAWYAEQDMIAAHGKLGRSQGCFAVGDSALAKVFDHLGEGRLLFAAKA